MAFNVEEVCDQLQEALRVFVRLKWIHVAYFAENADWTIRKTSRWM